MHHHPEKEDIVFSYKEQNGNITEFFVGEDSVEIVMDKLIKDGKLFILNPEKEKLFKEMEKNPYYHETRTKEFAADALEANEAMIHYDPENKEVLITSCDKDGIFDHFVFDKKQSVAGLKEELEKEGIKLISRDDLEIKNAKPAVREKPVSNDQKVESTDNHLSAAEFLHRLTQKKVNGYLNKFDKGIIWWQDGKDGKVFFSYKIDGFIKTVAKDEFAKDLPILKENHHCLLRPRDLNKIIRKTLPAR